MTPQYFQTLVRESRKSAGLTQQQLADIVGVTGYTITQFENGKQNITLELFCSILNALHIELRQIPDRSWFAYLKIVETAKGL